MPRPRRNLRTGYPDRIRSMASVGASKATIAKREGVSSTTFRMILERDQRAKEAFEAGRGELESELVGSLYERAVDPKNRNPTPAIFLLKSMFAYCDSPLPPQRPEESRVRIELVLPQPLGRDEYERLVASVPPKRLPEGHVIDVESQ